MNGLKKLFIFTWVVTWEVIVCLPADARFAGGNPRESKPYAGESPAEQSLPAAAADQSKVETVATDFCQCVDEIESAAVAKIEKALIGALHMNGIEYHDTPLIEAVAQLQQEYEIPIQLDKQSMEAAGIAADIPVSVSLRNISFRSALRIMLRNVELTYLVRDEVLLITTKEDAESELITCVYDVHDLPWETIRHIQPGAGADYNPLIGAITDCIATNTWNENGGGAAAIRLGGNGLLVVSQTRAVHHEIRGLFAAIRKMQENIVMRTKSAGIRSSSLKNAN